MTENKANGWAFIILAGIGLMYAPWVLGIATLFLLGLFVLKCVEVRQNINMKIQLFNESKDRELAYRADIENMEAEFGIIEGQYPGATMPLTQPILDDYDDGLDWK